MEIKNIAAALVKAQKGFAPALKTKTNPHFRSKYTDLAGCVEAVMDALNDNGIMLMQKPHEAQGGVQIETLFIHESGETLSGGIIFVPADKGNAQGYGSALTYARRYSLMAACGIAPEDDDGNAASQSQPKQQPQQAAKFDQQGYDQAMSAIAQAKEMRELKGHYEAAIALYPQMTNEIKAAAGDRRKQLESMVAA